RIACRLANLFAAGEYLSVLDCADAAQDFRIREEIKGTDLIVRAPAPPVRRRAGQQLTHSQLFALVQRPGGSHVRFTPQVISGSYGDGSDDEALAQIAFEHLAIGVARQRL